MPFRSRPARPVVLVAATFVLVVLAVLAACGSDTDSATDAPTTPTPIPTASRVEPSPVPQSEPTDERPTTPAEPTSTDRRAAQSPTPEPSQIEFETDGFVADDPTNQRRYDSIRDVDFEDGFTYVTGLEYTLTATVSGGRFETGELSDGDYFFFGVGGVEFADLDGDGADEAVVATTWNGGGSGYFDSVRAFRLREGALESAGVVPFGDRADGGIQGIAIDDGAVLVRSFAGTQGACCPNRIVENRLVLGEAFLTLGERGDARTWLSSQTSDEEIVFQPGTSSAVLEVWADIVQEEFHFEAAAGQRVRIRVIDGPTPTAFGLYSEATGSLAVADEIELPEDGIYDLAIVFDLPRDAPTLFELSIDAEEPRVTWTPEVSQTVITEDPFVFTNLVWPQFDSAAAGTADANLALAEFVAGLDDYWIEDVTVFSEPQGESSYDVNYDVTFAGYDLASVRFDYLDYVCCRPYPGYGPHAAVVDLAAGRLLDVDEILDLDRRQEIIDIWTAELQEQSEIDAEVLELTGLAPDFDSVGLVPGGIEFGTERGSLGGGMPGTLTFVSFERLGDLVRPDIVGRVAGN